MTNAYAYLETNMRVRSRGSVEYLYELTSFVFRSLIFLSLICDHSFNRLLNIILI